ncbi:flippase [Photobacterium damselae subsp. damselae]|nr:flippase [Photobacterium damselae subsp. damselae]
MRYLENTSWLLGERILRMGVSLFVGIWVARYLGPDKFGLFSYAQSFVLIFSAFSTLGLDGILIRELVKKEKNSNELLGTAFVLRFLGSIMMFVFISIALFFQSNNGETTWLIFIIASASFFQSFNVIDFYFQSQVLSKYVVFSNLFSLLISSIIKIILILNSAPLVLFAYVILLDSIILSSGYIYFYKNCKLELINWKFRKDLAFSLLKESWPLALSAIVVSIYMKIDQVMIQNIIGNDAVGQYSAAVRLSEAWYFIPVVITSSLFPSIINAKEKSNKLYIERFQHLSDLLLWGAISIAIPVTFMASDIINLLYGKQYNNAADVLVIHIWASIFVFMTVSSGKFLIADGFTNKIFYRNLLGVLVNVLLNYIVIPIYGITGAAVTTLISWIVAGYLYDLFDKEIMYMFRIKTKSFNIVRIIRNIWGYK